ncbi:CLUMA_CG003524, isoform A [Clunio marinus]|uniref:CLUMA_CG003524, isoform A n=1 Tax=Clunio marinus TaxID=568069 RepID=A0A1J1HNN3_9DIPT|nr:CLUMA_CG003524, isoform A [Clunio marinus]
MDYCHFSEFFWTKSVGTTVKLRETKIERDLETNEARINDMMWWKKRVKDDESTASSISSST